MAGRFDLRGKVAIVTGGNGGIGLGMARGLADAGADVTHTTLPVGHQLSQADIALARDWIAGLPQAIAA